MSDQSQPQTCMTCTFSIWGVGLGFGFVCRNEQKMIEENTEIQPSGERRLFNIPRRGYICPHYVAPRGKSENKSDT